VLLERLLGTWTTSMQHVQMPLPVTGLQEFTRVLDGAFVMVRASADHPDFPDGLSLLGGQHMHYFDVRGVTRVFDLEVTDAGWSTIRCDDDFWQRAAILFVGDDAMQGSGENSHDEGATWEHDYTISYARVG
jgi:hypothetical protein